MKWSPWLLATWLVACGPAPEVDTARETAADSAALIPSTDTEECDPEGPIPVCANPGPGCTSELLCVRAHWTCGPIVCTGGDS
ncbi:hypothetical protein [Archangium lipolyticum]|uniref:hypothetical protein n=1 Tax=Archangium lipolyticum TaxID=2970465 RepID=UPI00214A6E49|nr:hypothetical protein [Archangium lipolyticum]